MLAQELRSRQQHEPRTAAPGLVALAAVAAALGTAGLCLLGFRFDVPLAWWVVLLVFVGLFALYVAGPAVARSLRRSAE